MTKSKAIAKIKQAEIIQIKNDQWKLKREKQK